MEMNKIMKGTALTALAAATWFAAGTTDAAAKTAENPIDVNNVSVDTYGQSMSVRVAKGSAMEVHVGVGSYNKNKGTVKVSAWDVYEVGEYKNDSFTGVRNIDLSKLNSTKDSYIAVKTDKSDPIYIKIPAAVKKQKAAYNGGNSQVTITGIKQGTGELKDVDCRWEYRTPYSGWEDFDLYEWVEDDKTSEWKLDTTKPVANFENLQQQGATLYVRASATESEYYDKDKDESYNMKPSGTIKDADDKSTDAVEYPLYESGSLPGKESKLTIKKQANGPKVSVDYVKNQVNLPRDVETRMIIGSEYYFADNLADVKEGKVNVDKFFNVSGKKDDVALTDAQIAEVKAATSGVLEVRKKADEGKKKSASKWTIVKVVNPEEMTVKVDDKDKEAIKDGGIVTTSSAVAFAVTDGSISVKYNFDSKNKYKGKVEIVNSGKVAYEVVIDSTAPASDKKGTVIAAAGGKKSIRAANGNTIYIRVAGDKKAKTFAGKYTVVAKTIY